jgi:hypothetical protein
MKKFFLTAALVSCLWVSGASVIDGSDKVASVFQEKEYKKVETNEVPANILKNASTRYSGYALNEAYVSEDGEYKLVVSKDRKTVKAYYKSTGEFIKEEAK